MIPPNEIQVPFVPADVSTSLARYLKLLGTRLTNWVSQVGQSFQSQVLRQVPITLTDPQHGGVGYTIDADTDGTPRALCVGDGRVLNFVLANPAVGEWTITTDIHGNQTVQFGDPVGVAWFSYLVAR